ncbi:MAG: hypothetical protein KDJ15_05130 [Alphaproteobacteria bacterium]|nr:hypothetical protein [Alphaproteobacteria bacterium]
MKRTLTSVFLSLSLLALISSARNEDTAPFDLSERAQRAFEASYPSPEAVNLGTECFENLPISAISYENREEQEALCEKAIEAAAKAARPTLVPA